MDQMTRREQTPQTDSAESGSHQGRPVRNPNQRKRSTPSFVGLTPSSLSASRVGRGNRARDTKPELLLRKTLWKLGLRYRLHFRQLPGRPDLVVPGRRIAVFCDGDFWHGRNWADRKARLAVGSNASYWVAKIERNIERDREVDSQLAAMGWTSVRFWEGEIRNDVECVALRLLALVRNRDID
jgi:DNA mismatch endonuclease (patch repair protein)